MISRKIRFAAALAFVVAMAACDDDPVDPGTDPADDVVGVELVLSGATIASYDGATSTWTGELTVEVGMETAHISVRFIDENGDPVALGSDFYLDVEVGNEEIAEFEQDTPGEMGGHLHGEAVGETDIVFSLMHGAVGSGHADFVTTAVHAHVEAG